MAQQPNLTRKTLIVAGTEAVSGEDAIAKASPFITAGATNPASMAFLAFDEINPLSVDFNVVDTAPVRASLTPQKQLIGRKLVNVRPKTMWMNSPGVDFVNLTDSTEHTYPRTDSGSPGANPEYTKTAGADHDYCVVTNTGTSTASGDTSGHAPFFGSLLRACGLKQENEFSASVVYTPRSSSFETATVYVYADQILHKSTGCVGNFTLAGTAGEGIELMFDLQGNYIAPTGANTQPALRYPADTKKLMNFSRATIDNTGDAIGYEGSQATNPSGPIIRSFNFDAGVTVTERGDINSSEGLFGLFITDRAPTLDLVVEVENRFASNGSTPGFNPIQDMADAYTHNIVFQHGGTSSTGTAHEKTKFTFPQAQLVDVQYGDDSGIRTYNLSYSLTSTADDGEYKIETGNPSDAKAFD